MLTNAQCKCLRQCAMSYIAGCLQPTQITLSYVRIESIYNVYMRNIMQLLSMTTACRFDAYKHTHIQTYCIGACTDLKA